MYRIKNEQKVIDFIKRNEQLLFYGTGNVAMKTLDILKEFKVVPSGFAVSPDCFNGGGEINDIPVYNVCALPGELKEAGILLTLNPVEFENVIKTLEMAGIHNYTAVFLEEAPAIEITTRIGCTVNCRYCPQNKLLSNFYSANRSRQSVMSYEDFTVYLEKIPKSVEIIFSGMCEPFLNEACSKMIRYAYCRGYKIGLNTTLEGLQSKDYDDLKDIDFMWVVLHLPDQQGNAHINVTEEYLEHLKFFLSLKKDGREMVTKISCHGDLEARCKEIVSSSVFCSETLYDRAGNLDSDQLRHYHWEAPIFCGKSLYLHNNILLPDGTITLCCMDYGLKAVLGNLRDQSYEEILQGEPVRRLAEAMRRGEECICQYCHMAMEYGKYEKWM